MPCMLAAEEAAEEDDGNVFGSHSDLQPTLSNHWCLAPMHATMYHEAIQRNPDWRLQLKEQRRRTMTMPLAQIMTWKLDSAWLLLIRRRPTALTGIW